MCIPLATYPFWLPSIIRVVAVICVCFVKVLVFGGGVVCRSKPRVVELFDPTVCCLLAATHLLALYV